MIVIGVFFLLRILLLSGFGFISLLMLIDWVKVGILVVMLNVVVVNVVVFRNCLWVWVMKIVLL